MPGDATWPLATSPADMLQRVEERAERLWRRDRFRALAVAASVVTCAALAPMVLSTRNDRSELRTLRPVTSPTSTSTTSGIGTPPGHGDRNDNGRVAAADGSPTGREPTRVEGPAASAPTAVSPTSLPSSSATSGGTRLAFVRDDRIWLVNTNGSGLRALTPAGESFSDPHWSPDGRRLVATWLVSGATRVAVVELDGTARPLTDPDDDARDPRWSPDGTRLVYRCGNGTCIVGTDGTDQKVVSATHFGARWAADGTRLLALRADGSGGTTAGAVVTIRPDGDDERVVTGTPAAGVDWSPDGDWIAFARAHDSGVCSDGRPTCPATWNIWLVRPDGSDMRRLTSGARDVSPSFE